MQYKDNSGKNKTAHIRVHPWHNLLDCSMGGGFLRTVAVQEQQAVVCHTGRGEGGR